MKIGYAIAALLLTGTPAFAADIDYAAPGYDWSGCYLGGHAGYAWGDSTTVDTINPGGEVHATAEIDPEGAFGGLHAGCNYQIESGIVLGIEGDINLSDIDGSTDDVDSDGGPRTGFVHESELEWFGAIRARLGFAMGSFLPYLAGGFAFGNYVLDLAHNSDLSHNEEILTGWTIGGGAEYAFSPTWSARIEYRYTDYGTLHDTFDGFPNEDLTADLTTHDIRLGLTFLF